MMEPGWYWVKWYPNKRWSMALYEGDRWVLPGSFNGKPAIIGPRIEPPPKDWEPEDEK